MASLSDCFSNATVSTRSWMPACTRLRGDDGRGATDRAGGVHPEHAACPTAPSASARYSSGIITPSKKSGALPMTTASMSAQVMLGVGERPLRAASRTRPAIETSPRVAWCLVWPMPTTATRSLAISALLPGRDQVLLQAGAATWRGRRPGRPRRCVMRVGGLADADEPGGHHRVGGQRAAGRVDADVVAEPERLAQDQLLVGERRVQLGDVDLAVGHAGLRGGDAGRRRVGEVAERRGSSGSMRWSMPRIHAGRSHSSRARVAGGEHDGGGAVGDRRAVVLAQRRDEVGLGQQRVGAESHASWAYGLSSGRRGGCGRRPRRSRPRWPSPASRQRPRLQGGEASPSRARAGAT